MIRRDDGEDILGEQEFAWQREWSAQGTGLTFDPSEIASLGGGEGKYVVAFCTADGKELFDKKFKLVEAE